MYGWKGESSVKRSVGRALAPNGEFDDTWTKRAAPARRAASSTSSVPPTFTSKKSRTVVRVDHRGHVEDRHLTGAREQRIERCRIADVADHRVDGGTHDLEDRCLVGAGAQRAHRPSLRDQGTHEVLSQPAGRTGHDRRSLGGLSIGQLHASPHRRGALRQTPNRGTADRRRAAQERAATRIVAESSGSHGDGRTIQSDGADRSPGRVHRGRAPVPVLRRPAGPRRARGADDPRVVRGRGQRAQPVRCVLRADGRRGRGLLRALGRPDLPTVRRVPTSSTRRHRPSAATSGGAHCASIPPTGSR